MPVVLRMKAREKATEADIKAVDAAVRQFAPRHLYMRTPWDGASWSWYPDGKLPPPLPREPIVSFEDVRHLRDEGRRAAARRRLIETLRVYGC